MSEAIERDQDLSEWESVRESLDEVDTDYVMDQLDVMGKAELTYSDGKTSEWNEDIAEKYRKLVKGFGGEEQVSQYLEIGGNGVAVAVEYDDEPLFTVKAIERYPLAVDGPDTDLDTAL